MRALMQLIFAVAVAVGGAATVSAETSQAGAPATGTKAAYHPPAGDLKFNNDTKGAIARLKDRKEWVFSAPPRGTVAEEKEIYDPIMAYLSQATGQRFVFKPSGNWLAYGKEMTEGRYDLVFDGPHFNGWREARLQHRPLVKLPEDFVFVVAARADDASIKDVKSLAGRAVCAHAPPNLGTLTMMSKFDNPSRQPFIVQVEGWKASYEGVLSKECVATVLPLKNLNKFDNGANKKTRILYQHVALPNQAFSAAPSIPADVQVKIAKALLSEEGKRVAAKLLETYAAKQFVTASPEEYAGLGILLKDSLYYQ